MKKLFKVTAVMLCCVALVFAFTACGKNQVSGIAGLKSNKAATEVQPKRYPEIEDRIMEAIFAKREEYGHKEIERNAFLADNFALEYAAETYETKEARQIFISDEYGFGHFGYEATFFKLAKNKKAVDKLVELFEDGHYGHSLCSWATSDYDIVVYGDDRQMVVVMVSLTDGDIEHLEGEGLYQKY